VVDDQRPDLVQKHLQYFHLAEAVRERQKDCSCRVAVGACSIAAEHA